MVTVNVHKRESVQCCQEEIECCLIVSFSHQQVPNAPKGLHSEYLILGGHPKGKEYHRPIHGSPEAVHSMLNISQ
jgi:hypothetical protein